MQGDLRSGSSATARRRGFRMVLVFGQVIVSQFLLVGGALLFGTYLEMQRLDPGFDVDRNVVVAGVYSATALDFARIEEGLRTVPGVLRVSSMTWLPFVGGGNADVFLTGADTPVIKVNASKVGPKYFAIMGTRLLRGRDFESNDAGAVVVNEAMARRYWGSADAAMGKALRVGKTESQVVGVAENGKYGDIHERPQPFLFVREPLSPRDVGLLLIETVPGIAPAMLDSVRHKIGEFQPQAMIFGLDTLSHLMILPLFPYRMSAVLIGVLALLGVSLAGAGLYGIIACNVAQRTHEIGVRIALGAVPANILSAVLIDVMWKAMTGSLIGVALAVVTMGAISRQTQHVRVSDPVGIAGGVLAFLVIAALAAYAPARRAMRVDPMVALREE
jgi:hypothetical protein